GTWEERGEKIVCESVRRLKGTEFDTVILADDREEFDQQKLYVGVSRAVSQLIVIGPTSLGEQLGLI
ncbi:MAG: ATP-binding domain-containing protein, partial [Actinomycetota bacterium]